MKTYKVLKNQSIVDVAIQLYGNVEAVPELLYLNKEVLGRGSGTLSIAEMNALSELDLGLAITTGTMLNYDGKSELRNALVLNTLQQYGDDKRGYILATVTENEVTIVPDVPVPPDPEPYIFHPDTLVFLDDRVGDEPGGDWKQYIATEDAIALDRLVRDLHGESNDNYGTSDIWGKLKGVYPVMGAEQLVHEINLVDNVAGAERLSWSGTTIHGLNSIGMDGLTGIADTGIVDGTDTAQDDVCLGIVWSNYIHEPAAIPDYPNTYIGALNGSNIVWIRNIFGHYEAQVTTTGGTFASTAAYQVNDYLHMEGKTNYQSLFVGSSGALIASKPYAAGVESGKNFTLGRVAGSRGIEADVNFAYVAKSLSTVERKGLMNAVNYFLYQKGIRGSFTAIV